MVRLIKAEWYRTTRSSSIIKWFFLVTIALFMMAFLNIASEQKATASSYIFAFNEQVSMFFPMFFSVFAATFVGMPFINKTAMYEIMAGNRISHIINSKICVIVPLVVLTVTGFFSGIIIVLGMVNGYGELDNMPKRVLLLFIVMLHITLVGVLSVTAVRHAIGMVVAFLRFGLLEEIAMVLINLAREYGYDESVKRIGGWFINEQMCSLPLDTIPNAIFVKAILGTIIEVAIWYLISYIGYKKKKFA